MKKSWWVIIVAILVILILVFSYLKYKENSKLKEQTLIGYKYIECLSEAPILANSTRVDPNACSSIGPGSEYYKVMIGHDDRNINVLSEVMVCMNAYSNDRNGEQLKICLKNNLPTLKQKLDIS